MTILFNIRLFILRMLPTALRTDRMIDWIESMFTHGANIMLRLHLLRNATRYEISLNGTVIAMERALNDLFDPILRRIYIEDASTRENPTFWFDNEGQENPTMWFDNEGQTLLTMWLDDELNANTHFIVYVPNGLGYNAAQMASLINRLRFAGRIHAVQGYNWATAPTNATAPVVSGSTTIGSTLTTTDGSWNGTAPFTYTYQWRRNGTAISGATSSTYVVALADMSTTITCLVTATNIAGSASQASNGVSIPAQAPVNTVAPVVSGSNTIGSTLTTTSGTWSTPLSPSFTYQWRRNGTDISGATSSTYVVALADVSATITCLVTATNAAGSASQASNGIAIPALWTETEITAKIWASWQFEQSGVADGQPITSLTDFKGVRTITSASGSQPVQETNELNGRGVANFANNSRLAYAGAIAAISQPYEFYQVVKLDALVNGQRIIRLGANDNGIIYGGGTGSTGALRPFAGNDGPIITLTQNQWAITRFLISGLSAESQLNAGTAVTGNSGTNTASNDSVTFGARNAGETNGADMQLAHFTIVQTPLTTTEREKYEGWLAHRYGLTSVLPALHPFKTNPPQV